METRIEEVFDRWANEQREIGIKMMKTAAAIQFTLPGIPCIYYGSEWGIKGRKEEGDKALRPEIVSTEFNDLTEFIAKAAKIQMDVYLESNVL